MIWAPGVMVGGEGLNFFSGQSTGLKNQEAMEDIGKGFEPHCASASVGQVPISKCFDYYGNPLREPVDRGKITFASPSFVHSEFGYGWRTEKCPKIFEAMNLIPSLSLRGKVISDSMTSGTELVIGRPPEQQNQQLNSLELEIQRCTKHQSYLFTLWQGKEDMLNDRYSVYWGWERSLIHTEKKQLEEQMVVWHRYETELQEKMEVEKHLLAEQLAEQQDIEAEIQRRKEERQELSLQRGLHQRYLAEQQAWKLQQAVVDKHIEEQLAEIESQGIEQPRLENQKQKEHGELSIFSGTSKVFNEMSSRDCLEKNEKEWADALEVFKRMSDRKFKVTGSFSSGFICQILDVECSDFLHWPTGIGISYYVDFTSCVVVKIGAGIGIVSSFAVLVGHVYVLKVSELVEYACKLHGPFGGIVANVSGKLFFDVVTPLIDCFKQGVVVIAKPCGDIDPLKAQSHLCNVFSSKEKRDFFKAKKVSLRDYFSSLWGNLEILSPLEVVYGVKECRDNHMGNGMDLRNEEVVTLYSSSNGQACHHLPYMHHDSIAGKVMYSPKAAMTWYEDVFSFGYDLDLFNIVAVPEFHMRLMENKSFNIFSSKFVWAFPQIASDGCLRYDIRIFKFESCYDQGQYTSLGTSLFYGGWSTMGLVRHDLERKNDNEEVMMVDFSSKNKFLQIFATRTYLDCSSLPYFIKGSPTCSELLEGGINMSQLASNVSYMKSQENPTATQSFHDSLARNVLPIIFLFDWVLVVLEFHDWTRRVIWWKDMFWLFNIIVKCMMMSSSTPKLEDKLVLWGVICHD